MALDDQQVRTAVFAHLERLTALHPEGVTSADLNTFTVQQFQAFTTAQVTPSPARASAASRAAGTMVP